MNFGVVGTACAQNERRADQQTAGAASYTPATPAAVQSGGHRWTTFAAPGKWLATLSTAAAHSSSLVIGSFPSVGGRTLPWAAPQPAVGVAWAANVVEADDAHAGGHARVLVRVGAFGFCSARSWPIASTNFSAKATASDSSSVKRNAPRWTTMRGGLVCWATVTASASSGPALIFTVFPFRSRCGPFVRATAR